MSIPTSEKTDPCLLTMSLGHTLQSERIDWNARRISVAKYLGELYNYRLVESSLVFDVLYSLITFGHVLSVDGMCTLSRKSCPVVSFHALRVAGNR
jgi:hypothetical protein